MNYYITESYLQYKKNSLIEYVKLISEIITLENNDLFNNKQNFNTTLKKIIDIYVNKYYFAKDFDKNILKQSFKYNSENISFGITLMAIYDAYYFDGNLNIIKENEAGRNHLAIIISIAKDLDKMANPFKNDINSIKPLIKKLISDFSQIKYLKIFQNHENCINDLYNLICSNNKKENEFFQNLDFEKFKNQYIDITSEKKYFIVNYNYNIEKLNEFDKLYIEQIYKKLNLNEKFYFMAYEQATIALIYFLMNDLDYSLLIPIPSNIIARDINIKRICKVFQSSCIKNNIKLLINYQDLIKNNDNIKKLKYERFKFIIDCSNEEILNNLEVLQNDDILIITNEFLRKNIQFNDILEKKRIQFITKTNIKVYNKEELLESNK